MAIRPMIPRSAVALMAVFGFASLARGQDLGTYQQAIGDLANASGIRSPAYLVGIGQFYCFMKVGIGEPVGPDEVLAALHRKHPNTQPTSYRVGRAQRRAIILADLMLCPN